jgi:Holliday junction resolvase-like predicted endonuclease
MAQHLDLGRKGEALAKAHLENAGYEIMDENWTHGKLEVDLIAYKDKVIIFTEVKTRTSSGFWPAGGLCRYAQAKAIGRSGRRIPVPDEPPGRSAV